MPDLRHDDLIIRRAHVKKLIDTLDDVIVVVRELTRDLECAQEVENGLIDGLEKLRGTQYPEMSQFLAYADSVRTLRDLWDYFDQTATDVFEAGGEDAPEI